MLNALETLWLRCHTKRATLSRTLYWLPQPLSMVPVTCTDDSVPLFLLVLWSAWSFLFPALKLSHTFWAIPILLDVFHLEPLWIIPTHLTVLAHSRCLGQLRLCQSKGYPRRCFQNLFMLTLSTSTQNANSQHQPDPTEQVGNRDTLASSCGRTLKVSKQSPKGSQYSWCRITKTGNVSHWLNKSWKLRICLVSVLDLCMHFFFPFGGAGNQTWKVLFHVNCCWTSGSAVALSIPFPFDLFTGINRNS